MEPNNTVNRYAVGVKTNETMVGNLVKGENGVYVKVIFLALRCVPFLRSLRHR